MSENNGKSLAVQSSQVARVEQFGEMTVQNIVDRKRKIVEVMEAVMKENEHYGRIPGCGDKPALFKAGAEVLATTFGLAPKFKIEEKNFPNDHREYLVICTLVHIASGASVGDGLGSCSTKESKYRWRKGGRKCPNCSKEAIIKGKSEFGGGWLCWDKKGGCGAKWPNGAKEIEDQNTDRCENPDIADQYNTVLKMAKKRAQIDATLTATGASDLLAQDLEDLPPGSMPDERDPEEWDSRNQPPAQAKSANTDDKLEAIALDIISDLAEAMTPDEVKALMPRFAALPKGCRPRISAYEAYKKRLDDVTRPSQQGAA